MVKWICWGPLRLCGYVLLRRDRKIGVRGREAAFIKSTCSHETVADSLLWHDQLEVLAFKIYGLRDIKVDISVVYRPPSQSFNLDGILIERLQETTRATNLTSTHRTSTGKTWRLLVTYQHVMQGFYRFAQQWHQDRLFLNYVYNLQGVKTSPASLSVVSSR